MYLDLLLRMMRSFVRKGSLTIIDADGKRHVFTGEPGPHVTVRVHDKALYRRFVFDPDLASGESYMDGKVTFEEGSTLRDFFQLYFINQRNLESYPVRKFFNDLSYRFRRWHLSNKLGQATKNVSHHYDIGNELYKLFLDKSMTYSCAYFRSPEEELEQAQRNKLRLAAAKLDLKPGQRVLDIGSGWGDMGIYMAQMEDVSVTGVTLSKEQYDLSNQKAQAAGVGDRVKFELMDYRDLIGKFDRIVSIGMFEHVGAPHYDEFFAKVKSILPDDGVMMLHSIGSSGPPTTSSSFYRKYIFPGGYVPSLSEVFGALERNYLWALDIEILRVHYAETLKNWYERFEMNRDKVVQMYDERFARMWEFYLNSAEMIFRYGEHMVFQLQLSPTRDATPLQRDYIIDRQREYERIEKDRLKRAA